MMEEAIWEGGGGVIHAAAGSILALLREMTWRLAYASFPHTWGPYRFVVFRAAAWSACRAFYIGVGACIHGWFA